MKSIQNLMMRLVPNKVLDIMCFACPKTVIGLLCHWLNEKNPILRERFLAPRFIAPVHVSKKLSKLSELSILNLLRQDESLWKFYAPNLEGGRIFNLKGLPYILLQLIFDLGGTEGREKVRDLVLKCRTTLGSPKQGEILRNFNVETVVDIFEMILEKPQGGGPAEVRMCLMNSINPNDGETYKILAIWLDHWDRRMSLMGLPAQSSDWVAKLPGERAFKLEELLKDLEFRRKYEPTNSLYEYRNEWKEFVSVKEE